MAEILAPDGVWSPELIALMLPVALEQEAEMAETMFGANLAAVSSLMGGEGVEAFRNGIELVKQLARNSALEARGAKPRQLDPKIAPTAADKMMQGIGKLGIKVKGPKRPMPPIKGTKVHGGDK